MRSSRRSARPIERQIAGVGRLTSRTRRMTVETRNELDRAIMRAAQAGHLEQLRLLKDRRVSPLEFLDAARSNRVLALRPASPLRPLVTQWLAAADLRPASRERYQQSWNFMFDTLPADACLDALTDNWWVDFACSRGVSNATLNRDRAPCWHFVRGPRTWATSVRPSKREDGRRSLESRGS
jgi:hypothetical protein